MSRIRIQAPEGVVKGKVILPGSKSIANRLQIINALSPGPSKISALPENDDVRVLEYALSASGSKFDAGDAGTAFRFLTSYLSIRKGDWQLNGSARMLRRPIGPLVNALRQAGACIDYVGEEGFPPLIIHGRELRGGEVAIDASISSQFVSSILMIAPLMKEGLDLKLLPDTSSFPYIEMTLGLMKACGAVYERTNDRISVMPGMYHGVQTEIEKDWSAASFMYEICSLSEHAEITLQGLSKESLQGDRIIATLMNNMNVSTDFSVMACKIRKQGSVESDDAYRLHCIEFPDLVPAILCTCAGLGREAFLSGLRTLTQKESDRIYALVTELTKLGAVLAYDEATDILHLEKGELHPYQGTLQTYNDHRIAMALAPLSLITGTISLDDAAVVSKSFPGYWDALRATGFRLAE